jgi:hypothetical protein
VELLFGPSSFFQLERNGDVKTVGELADLLRPKELTPGTSTAVLRINGQKMTAAANSNPLNLDEIALPRHRLSFVNWGRIHGFQVIHWI